MTQSGSAISALRWAVQDIAALTKSTLRGCGCGGWWAYMVRCQQVDFASGLQALVLARY